MCLILAGEAGEKLESISYGVFYYLTSINES